MRKSLFFLVFALLVLTSCDSSSSNKLYGQDSIIDEKELLHKDFASEISKPLIYREVDDVINAVKESNSIKNIKTVHYIYETTHFVCEGNEQVELFSCNVTLYENTVVTREYKGTIWLSPFQYFIDVDATQYIYFESGLIKHRIVNKDGECREFSDEYDTKTFSSYFDILNDPIYSYPFEYLLWNSEDKPSYTKAGILKDGQSIYVSMDCYEYVFEGTNVAYRRITDDNYIALARYITGSNGEFDITKLPTVTETENTSL